jgi:hypothetical protein
MFGFFGRFGRSEELRALDDALAATGLQHRAVPDAVKLTLLRQVQQETGRKRPDDTALADAAHLLAYLMLGAQVYGETVARAAVDEAEARVAAAAEAGDSLDARLVVLALHAGLVQPEVVARYELSIA